MKTLLFFLSITLTSHGQVTTIDANWQDTIAFINESSVHITSPLERENLYQSLEIKNDTLILKQTKLGKPFKKVTIALCDFSKVYGNPKNIIFRFPQRFVYVSRYNPIRKKYNRFYATPQFKFKIRDVHKSSNIYKSFKRIAYLAEEKRKKPKI